MSGGALGTAFTGAILAYGGAMFARIGRNGPRPPSPAAGPGQELPPVSAGASPAWQRLWLASPLFGGFVLGRGLLLLIGPFLPERGA